MAPLKGTRSNFPGDRCREITTGYLWTLDCRCRCPRLLADEFRPLRKRAQPRLAKCVNVGFELAFARAKGATQEAHFVFLLPPFAASRNR